MRQTLIDLFTSKKFLTALTAIVVYIAGRFGFDVDTVALDHIYAALLVYIGGQAIADHGKSAAQVRAAGITATLGTVELDTAPARSSYALGNPGGSLLPALVLVVLGLGAVATLPACGAAQRAGSAVIDCTAADHAAIDALIVDLATKRKPDGSRDWPAIEVAAISAGVSIGGCALVEFVGSQLASSSSGLAARTGAAPDPGQAALERARAHWGDVRWTTEGVR